MSRVHPICAPYMGNYSCLSPSVASPHRFLKRQQSVFPLFSGFVCSVIVVFCRCLCTCLWSLCWRRCLRLAKRCSLCSAVSCRRLLCSRWVLSRRSPKDFRWKIFVSEDVQSLALVNPALLFLLFCVICIRNCSWFTISNWVNIRRINSSWMKNDSVPCCLETGNTPWRHTVDDVRADTKRSDS